MDENEEITTITELQAAFGDKEAFDNALEAAIKAQWPREHTGARYFTPDWDYQDRDWLAQVTSEALAGGVLFYSPEKMKWHATYAVDEPEEYRRTLKTFDLMGMDDPGWAIEGYIRQQFNPEWLAFEQDYVLGIIETDMTAALQDRNGGTYEVNIPQYEWVDELERRGVYFDAGISWELEHVKLRANLEFSIGEEWNYEQTNIVTAYEDVLERALFDGTELTEEDRVYLENNSMTWLLATQGYTLEDYIVQSEEGFESPFLASVESELENMPYHMASLTLCAEMTYQQVIGLMTGTQNLMVDPRQKNFTMGLYQRWNGSGSVLELAPEKPFVISIAQIGKVDCESRGRNPGGYSVDEVYGLIPAAWTPCVVPTDEEPVEMPHIDLPSLNKALERARDVSNRREAARQEPGPKVVTVKVYPPSVPSYGNKR